MTSVEDLHRPPFAVAERLGPEQVAEELVTCFDRLATRPDALQHAHALAMRSVPFSSDEALHRAGHAIARDIDRGVGAGVAQGYHNARHFLEVTLCARYLALGARIGPLRTARVVTAALIHDFHHDGSRSTDAPFRLESLAMSEAARYLRHDGVAMPLQRQLDAMVLATEPMYGAPFARACVVHQAQRTAAPAHEQLPAPLLSLLDDPELALDAVLLTEADVLPSIGLGFAHSEWLQGRLATEWDTPLGREDKIAFVDHCARHLQFARFFMPNIDALRAAYLGRA